ncbi:MAG: glycerate kinase [Verrucomicrobiota bacterium]
MSLNVVIVPDKFKGTLTARAAAGAIDRGWRKVRPGDHLELIPMSDGGDGFGEVLGALSGAELRSARTVDAAWRKCSAPWWWIPSTETAIVESARAIGLAMLPAGRFHPFQLDTSGLGRLLKTIAEGGAKRCLVGIGGSATNDGGFGMARALGWGFLDGKGNRIERWTELHRLKALCAPSHPKLFQQIVVSVDVKNPLLGARGATRIYGPQKGLRPEDFALAESCLRRLSIVVREALGKDFAGSPGAGAAGGLGFALNAFLGAKFETGFDLFARYSKLRRRIRSADLVLTGEGAIDASTMMGKGTGQIAALCREMRVPCIALAGVVRTGGDKRRLFARTLALTELTSEAKAKAAPALWLEQLAKRAARTITPQWGRNRSRV